MPEEENKAAEPESGGNDEENPATTTGKTEPKEGEAITDTKGDGDKHPTKEENVKNLAATEESSRDAPLPKSFYDPTTHKVMTDPVVAPSGISYERNDDLEEISSYYPNRAMKAYIDREIERLQNAGSMRGKFIQINESLRSGFQKLLDQSAIPSPEYRPLPEGFYCPISFDLIHDPVIDPDGHSYERAAIHHWIRGNNDSPITRNTLRIDQLYDNQTLLDALIELTEGDENEVVHPSIRRWKTDESARKKNPTAAAEALGITPGASSTTSTPATAGNNPSWPANHDELDELARVNRCRIKFTVSALVFALIVVLLFFPGATVFMVSTLFVAVFICIPVGNNRNQ